MRLYIAILIIILLATGAFFVWQKESDVTLGEEDLEEGLVSDRKSDVKLSLDSDAYVAKEPEIIITDLVIPWGIDFLPNGNMLLTERDGVLLEIDLETRVKQEIIVPNVNVSGEGGLLGLALDPNFESNNYLYVYVTSSVEGESVNQVVRYTYGDGTLSDEFAIIENIPGAKFHNGGRLAFSPDDYLFVSTGDASNPDNAQNLDSYAGKILRVDLTPKVTVEVYSHGNRNPQGLTWDMENRLWSSEHGRSGIKTGMDELNLIVEGENYGWPDSEGDNVFEGTTAPKAHSTGDVTWAPGDSLYWDGSIFIPGLRGATLYEAVIQDETVVEVKEHFVDTYGRLRTIVLGPDGFMYLATSNRDNRWSAKGKEDLIIRIDPKMFRD